MSNDSVPSSRDATTRTDVYSLGLVLYELLCEERGQVADASSPIALDRSICEVEPPLPSARAYAKGNHALARQLEGDLDTIVAMAIRKEPERRYGSAAELSADLGRYLDGLAVRARAGSIFYRTGKYVRRHRGTVLAGALLLASIAAGLVATPSSAPLGALPSWLERLLVESSPRLVSAPPRLRVKLQPQTNTLAHS